MTSLDREGEGYFKKIKSKAISWKLSAVLRDGNCVCVVQ